MGRAEHMFCALVFVVLGIGLACPKPGPVPVRPDADASANSGTGGAYVEPGPVPFGDVTRCGIACRHADETCPGSLNACTAACAKAGGANPTLVTCWSGAADCAALKACGRPSGASGALPHGR